MPSSASTRQLRLSSGGLLLETGLAGGCTELAAIGGTRSFSTRTAGFLGALASAGFDFADFGETGVSFPAELGDAAPRSQASSAGESEQAVACGSCAGSLLEKPSRTTNHTSRAPSGARFF